MTAAISAVNCGLAIRGHGASLQAQLGERGEPGGGGADRAPH
ncbi:hypothetical protein [Kamptonema formosum]|nr:hypothetical protein [Oscillatoria sp. PCC 10802]